ncbi:T9SS type A sorting domain-containing protein [uncultured Algibacter sp.]|uniref:T9SS type A sorting domain-containing protein n=1 Tax=uncultured Algibacter sp. TaxID=298659 RepID=UPI0032165D33
MKHKILLFFVVLTTFKTFSQNTFTFNGDGIWTDTTQWEGGVYPGTTINTGDNIVVLGKLTISENITITNNGTIESFSSASGDTPTINIIGSLVNNQIINFSRTGITVDALGSITTNVTSQLVVTNNSILTNTGTVNILGGVIRIASSVSTIFNDGTFNNMGTVEVLSGNFENKSDANNTDLVVFNNNGTFEVSNAIVTNRGDFKNNTNGILMISRTFRNDLTGRIDNEGEITVTGFSSSLINVGNLNNLKDILVLDFSSISMLSNSVFTNQIGGNVIISADSSMSSRTSNFTILGGKITNNGTFDNEITMSIELGGEFENNGTFDNGFGAQVVNNGILGGINVEQSGNFSNDGILSPGNSTDATGMYKLNGFFTSYTQTTSGSLKIELGGTVAGDNYDQIIVDRDAILEGTLNVSLVDGFDPAIGDVFTVLLQGRNVSGTFSTLNLPTLATNKEWDDVEYSSTDGVRISVKQSTLSISDLDKDSPKFKIYPNPVSNKIFISGISNTGTASIFDLNGKKVLDTELSTGNFGIDLKELNSGIYLLKFEGRSFKFVKQ